MTELPQNVTVLSSLSAGHDGYDISNERALRALSTAEDAHFWHVARNELIASRLRSLGAGRSVLELGCGGGAVAAHLERTGFEVVGVDGHLPRVVEAARRAPRSRFFVHDLARGLEPLATRTHDVVALFDVIEHLDDPLAALRDALRLTRPRGLLVGTVPALMSLWSRVDEYAGHRQRYDRAGLRRLLAGVTGADVIEVAPFNRHLVPLMWLQRRWVSRDDEAATAEANFKVATPLVNSAFLVAARVERALSPILDRSALPGASLWFALRNVGG